MSDTWIVWSIEQWAGYGAQRWGPAFMGNRALLYTTKKEAVAALSKLPPQGRMQYRVSRFELTRWPAS